MTALTLAAPGSGLAPPALGVQPLAPRDHKGPDRRGFDRLQRHLVDQGIEDEIRPEWQPSGASGEKGDQ